MLIIPKHIILKIMQEVVDKFLIPHFLRLGMDATGEWRKNVSVRAGDNVGYIDGRHYSEQLVYGRRPNKKQDPKALQRFAVGMYYKNEHYRKWLKVRGVEEHGIAIAYQIGKNGTELLKKGGSDLIEILESPQVINYINSQIGNYLRVEVELQIKRDAQKIFA